MTDKSKNKGQKWDGKSRVSNDLYRKNFNKIFKKDFLEEAEKEKKELEESYKESVRQTKERKHFHAKAIDGYGE